MKVRNPGVIEDYTVSETTLEQVFLSFAKKYNNAAKKEDTTAAKLMRTFSRTLSRTLSTPRDDNEETSVRL